MDYIRPHERKDTFKGKPTVYKITEFFTKIKGCAEPIRTVLIINPNKTGKKRYFALFTNDLKTPVEILADQYILRWHLENVFKFQKLDLNLDILPKSYSLNPKDKLNPNFLGIRVKLVAWLKAVIYNIIVDFKNQLPKEYHNKAIRTIIRKFILRPADIYLKNDTIEIILHHFKEINDLKEYCEKINSKEIRIPWLKNRKLKIALQYQPEKDHKEIRKLLNC
jgi:hypothetical protein